MVGMSGVLIAIGAVGLLVVAAYAIYWLFFRMGDDPPR
jgi:hypothetical protein